MKYSGAVETLAAKIVQCANEADNKVLEAAKLICEARKRVETGEADEAGKVTWYEWARKNIELSPSRLRELQRIAGAENPKKELERLRKLTQQRAERHRERKKDKTSAPLRIGGSDIKAVAEAEEAHRAQPISVGASTQAESDPERKSLIEWASTAPIEQVTKVLSFIQALDTAAPDTDTDRSPEQAAAP